MVLGPGPLKSDLVGLRNALFAAALIYKRLLIEFGECAGVKEGKRTLARCPTQMIPLDVLGLESLEANLLEQVCWCDGAECPRCRSNQTVKNGSYGPFQRYFCKNCGRTFNHEIGTIFVHSTIAL